MNLVGFVFVRLFVLDFLSKGDQTVFVFLCGLASLSIMSLSIVPVVADVKI